jgi:hypothetical protein
LFSRRGVEVVCQLTGLRRLHLWDPIEDSGLLLQLTRLKQLTHLEYGGALGRYLHTPAIWKVILRLGVLCAVAPEC